MVVLGQMLAWVWVVGSVIGAGFMLVAWWRPSTLTVTRTWDGVEEAIPARWWHVAMLKGVAVAFLALDVMVLDGLLHVGVAQGGVQLAWSTLLALTGVALVAGGAALVRISPDADVGGVPGPGHLLADSISSGAGSAARSWVRETIGGLILQRRTGRIVAAVVVWVAAGLCAAGAVRVWTEGLDARIAAPEMPLSGMADALDVASFYALWSVVAVVCASLTMSDFRNRQPRSALGWLAGTFAAVGLMVFVHAMT